MSTKLSTSPSHGLTSDIDVESVLKSFLSESIDTEFVYGSMDCAQWVCSYVERLCGVNPGKDLSERYVDEASCAQVLSVGGGLARVAQEAFVRVGLGGYENSSVSVGGVGVVGVMGLEYMGIRTEVGWVIKKRGRGFIGVHKSMPLLIGWNLPCRRL